MTRPLVVKVGGSLLDWPGLPGRLDAILAAVGDRGRPVFLAGGGRAADLVRDLDRAHGLGPPPSHALALHALELTAHLLAALRPGRLIVVDRIESLPDTWDLGLVPVLAPRRFLEEVDARSDDPLAHSWDVTSDSIAARVATHLGAPELVLLKSAALPSGTDRRTAARLGLVDAAFPEVAAGLGRVTYIHLRADDPRGQPLPASPGQGPPSA